MKFTILTLFPEMFQGPFSESIIKRAITRKILDIEIVNLRNFAVDKHKTVDDAPYGGGAGMVIKVDVVDRAISEILKGINQPQTIDDRLLPTPHTPHPTSYSPRPTPYTLLPTPHIIMLSASGERFTQKKAIELAKYDNIVLLCGHYEGFDQRVHDHLVDEEISIGDYVLTGGELPAMVLVDAISRMIPGVIREESAKNDSFMQSDISPSPHSPLLTLHSSHPTPHTPPPTPCSLRPTPYALRPTYDYPAYTRPEEYRGWKVPEILLSGDHQKIKLWRDKKRIKN